MARILSENELNSVIFDDHISDSSITLYYRNPTEDEIASFDNGHIKRKGKNSKTTTGENRINHGFKVLKGFKKGDFALKRDGKTIFFSSDRGDDDYEPNWKKLVKRLAPDIVSNLGMHVFEGSVEVADENFYDDEDDNKSGEKQEDKSLD